MKSLAVLCCLVAVALAVTEPEWENFKTKFNRKYKNPTEEAFRKKIFANNKMLIVQQNQRNAEGRSTFTMAVNQFADMTTQEFSQIMNNYKMHAPNPSKVKIFPSNGVGDAQVDWRTSGCVTGVKDQGQCGSCWAFSTIGSTEYVNCVNANNLVSLSEQNLVDCSWGYGNAGCNGGWMDSAFQYIEDNGGVDTEASYPYTAVSYENNCQYNANNVGGYVSGYVDVGPSGDEGALESASSTVGPISVAIDASQASFQLYSGGVYNEPLCSSTNLDHGVLVVGYGNDNGADYWLVKNSWGTGWGIAGYIEMSKGLGNQCGIATSASYPIV